MRKAVLVIHGFGGSPYSLEYLTSYLEKLNCFDVFTFILPGHFYKRDSIKHEDFILASEERIRLLISFGYKDILVVGHSMGGVISCHIASKYKEVKGLVLIAPAFHYLSVKDDDVNFIDSLKDGVSIIKDYSLNDFFNGHVKVTPKMVLEFTHLVKDYYDTPQYVSVPTLIVWGTKDKIVPFSSVKYVIDSLMSECKRLFLVRDASHNPFLGIRKKDVSFLIGNFLRELI